VMSVSAEGQKVIMSRASHRSVYGGVVLSGAMPIYIEPNYHPEVGFPIAVLVERVETLFNAHENVAAVHITSPNYYGILSDTAKIAAIAHRNQAAMLVDEAHGSHLNFHEKLPASATTLGAELVIQSTHKTQGALTQASMLHCNPSDFVNLARVGQVLALLQSSSPSSILLATLDAARMQMATRGHALLQDTIDLSQEARQQINEMGGLWCYGDDLVGKHGVFAYDPTKLIIRTTELGYTGFEFFSKLHKDYGIVAEFADLRQIICSITIGDTSASVKKLLDALRSMAADKRPSIRHETEVAPPAGLPKLEISPREAYFANARAVPIQQAIGHVVAENVIPYPPGIPLLVPGEVMEQRHLDYLQYIMSKGSSVVGTEDKTVATLRIVE
jgi:arginine decarboxylase